MAFFLANKHILKKCCFFICLKLHYQSIWPVIDLTGCLNLDILPSDLNVSQFHMSVLLYCFRTVNNQHDKNKCGVTHWLAPLENCQGRPWDVTQPSTHLHNLALRLFVTASAGLPLSPRRQVLDSQRYFQTDSERKDAELASCSLSTLTQSDSNALCCFMSSWICKTHRTIEEDLNLDQIEFTRLEFILYHPFLVEICLHCSLASSESHEWCVCLHGPFSLALSQKQAVWVKKGRESDSVCVCAHFPAAARCRSGTQSSTWHCLTHTHRLLHVHEQCTSVRVGFEWCVWKREEDFALRQTEWVRLRLHTHYQKHFSKPSPAFRATTKYFRL